MGTLKSIFLAATQILDQNIKL